MSSPMHKRKQLNAKREKDAAKFKEELQTVLTVVRTDDFLDIHVLKHKLEEELEVTMTYKDFRMQDHTISMRNISSLDIPRGGVALGSKRPKIELAMDVTKKNRMKAKYDMTNAKITDLYPRLEYVLDRVQAWFKDEELSIEVIDDDDLNFTIKVFYTKPEVKPSMLSKAVGKVKKIFKKDK